MKKVHLSDLHLQLRHFDTIRLLRPNAPAYLSRHISQSHPPIAFAGVAVGSEVVAGPSFGLTGLGAALAALALVQMSA